MVIYINLPYDWEDPDPERVLNALQSAYRMDLVNPESAPHIIYFDWRGRVYVRKSKVKAPFRSKVFDRLSIDLMGRVLSDQTP